MSRADGDLTKLSSEVKNSAADVEAWVAARRRNWPTASRIAARAVEVVDEPRPLGELTTEVKQQERPTRKAPCKYFARSRCTNGDRCRFSHERQVSITSEPAVAPMRIYKRFEPPTRSPLFVRLMQNDLDVENESVLRYVLQLAKAGYLE